MLHRVAIYTLRAPVNCLQVSRLFCQKTGVRSIASLTCLRNHSWTPWYCATNERNYLGRKETERSYYSSIVDDVKMSCGTFCKENKIKFQEWRAIERRSYSSNVDDMEISCGMFFREVERGDDLYIIDVREPSEVEAYGMIPNAKHIPLMELESALRLTDESFEKHYGCEKPPEEGDDVVFYCHGGIRSLKATVLARSMGYNMSKSLSGGFVTWSKYIMERQG